MQYYDIDLSKLKRYPIATRKNKVNIGQFAPISPPEFQPSHKTPNFIDLLPDILMAQDFKEIVQRVEGAYHNGRAVIFALGGHVIKCGLGSIIIDLMRRGIVNAILMNGAASIHDFEIAMIGETSEDVLAVLGEGEFGMAEETGIQYNEAINIAAKNNLGLGYSLGKYLCDNSFKYKEYSILAAAYEMNIPSLVSVAIGDDITHMHPEASGAAIGNASHKDFLTLASILPNLADGGVYFNIGSAVILPEVFLKAFSIVQNLGYDMSGLSTVNMDMISQYRPLTNVVKRPTARGGKGYNLIGAHEIMLPLLASSIIQRIEEES
ncbi:MAG TPA: deoxyhypusine synthase family protein [Desulfitobacterium dehalogenans]|uniref:Deoxyhypusine synthase family protein n=1 Tax=Desulfitobacterium dehalogenans TaxID=36854 RepID=A0A7C7D9W2_9FIRM|nr:deoxyhypusine synthase family protein [Desulfitobacterium dehalogenans]